MGRCKHYLKLQASHAVVAQVSEAVHPTNYFQFFHFNQLLLIIQMNSPLVLSVASEL